MIKILVLVVIVVFIYWFFILRRGRLDFWKIAAKYPDEAYNLFISEECWRVFEESLPNDHHAFVPKKDWTGPFMLRIPKLENKMIYIFGKYPEFEKSQNEFIARYDKNK